MHESKRIAFPITWLLAAAFCMAAALLFAPASTALAGEAREVSVQASQAQAANIVGKASSHALFRYGWTNGAYRAKTAGRVARYDVTGDGLTDTVVVRATAIGEDAPGLASGLSIKVNGKAAYALEAAEGGIDQVGVFVITLKNDVPLLFVSAYQADGTARQAILRHEGDEFVTVVDNDLLNREGTSNAHVSQVLPSGNRVIVQFDFVSCLTGVSRTSFTYEWRGHTMKRTRNTSRALRYATTSTGVFSKQGLVAARRFAVYAKPDLAHEAFTVKKGAEVRPLAIRLSGNRLLYKVQVGKRVGWIACPDATSGNVGSLLKGAYGKVAQNNRVPAYSKTAKLSVARLQKLSNHALFLARNEVYARHGFVFVNEELAGYFGSKGWYKPKDGTTVKLNAVETRNVLLMLSVEKNRRSPYVS